MIDYILSLPYQVPTTIVVLGALMWYGATRPEETPEQYKKRRAQERQLLIYDLGREGKWTRARAQMHLLYDFGEDHKTRPPYITIKRKYKDYG